MKRVFAVTILIAMVAAPAVVAQQKSLSSTMEVYVFPSQGQDSSQQSKDEAECYNWAVGNTGSDPFELAKQSQETATQYQQDMANAQSAGDGRGAKGAVGGAAAGALIGGIASDDAGKGAAIGAAAGLIGGRASRRNQQKKAAGQAEQSAASSQAATQGAMDNFKKAFSVCLEAKEYMVKY